MTPIERLTDALRQALLRKRDRRKESRTDGQLADPHLPVSGAGASRPVASEQRGEAESPATQGGPMAVQPGPEQKDTRSAREALMDLENDLRAYTPQIIPWPWRPYDTLPSTFVRTLPKFVPADTRCVKCGERFKIKLRHRNASLSDVEPHLAATRNEPFVPIDYLEITCESCGNRWARRPLDADGAPPASIDAAMYGVADLIESKAYGQYERGLCTELAERQWLALAEELRRQHQRTP